MKIPADDILIRMHEQGVPCFICSGAGFLDDGDGPDACPACERLAELLGAAPKEHSDDGSGEMPF